MSKQQIDPILMSIRDAAKLLGISPNHLRAMHDSGRLGPMPVRLGRKVQWSRKRLEKWVDAGCPRREIWLARKRA